jgi:glycosyltransferase involved in cell wall biosynthesis
MAPLVSILIPVFNQNAEYFRQCIQSALSQNYDNLEIIISDNHSTNDVAIVARQFDNEKIRLVSPPVFCDLKSNYVFAANNAHADSQYLCFLASDDVLYPTAISELVELLETNMDVAFASGNIHRCIELPKSTASHNFLIRPLTHSTRKLSYEEIIRLVCPWRMASTWMAGDLIRLSAYKATGGLAECDYMVNADQWLTKELLKHGKLGLIDKPLAFYRMRPPNVNAADGDRTLAIIMDNFSYFKDLKICTENLKSKKIESHIYKSALKFKFTTISLLLINKGSQQTYPQKQLAVFFEHIRCHSGWIFRVLVMSAINAPHVFASPAMHLIIKLRALKNWLNKGAYS